MLSVSCSLWVHHLCSQVPFSVEAPQVSKLVFNGGVVAWCRIMKERIVLTLLFLGVVWFDL